MMKKNIWIGAAVVAVIFAIYWFFFRFGGTEHYQLIPKKAVGVFYFNPYKLLKKVDLETITSSKMYKQSTGKIGSDQKKYIDMVIKDPTETGIDLTSDVVLSGFQDEEEFVGMLCFRVRSEEKLRAYLSTISKKEELPEVTMKDEIYYFGVGKRENVSSLVFWKGNQGAVLWGDYDDAVNWRKRVKALLKLESNEQLLSLEDFKKFDAGDQDLGGFLNMSALYDMVQNRRGMMSAGVLNENMKNVSMGMHLSFEKKAIEAEMKYFFKDEKTEAMFQVFKDPADIAPWMAGVIHDNPIAYMSMCIDYDKYLNNMLADKNTKDMILRFIENIGMTEKEIQSLGIQGMAISYAGLNMNMEKKVFDEYNPLTEEFEEVEREVPVYQNDLLISFKVKNTGPLKKFLDQKIMPSSDGLYTIPFIMGVNGIMLIKDGGFYIGTQKSVIDELKSKGKLANGLKGEPAKLIEKFPLAMRLKMNVAQWPEGTKKAMEFAMGDRASSKWNMFTKNFDVFEMTGENHKGTLKIGVAGDEKNSLMVLFKAIDQFVD